MTGRERLLAVAQGRAADRKPLMILDDDPRSDARVLRAPGTPDPERLTLVEVINPYGQAQAAGLNLNELIYTDPEAGNQKLDGLVEAVRQDIGRALESGADGIFYRLKGAEPSQTTPMQYGGHYLERDRELLSEIGDHPNVVFIDAGDGAYMDFVSDLPGAFFAWDIDRSDVSVVRMRSLRPGALMAEDPTADVLMADRFAKLERWLNLEEASANA